MHLLYSIMLKRHAGFVTILCWIATEVTSLKLPYTIPGPQSLNDKIAVVGAGPGGIHMALLLKEKGFTNVQVLEKTDRIGGKSRSIEHRGTVHEMGTVYLSKDYQMIKELSEKYVPGDIMPFPSASVWLDNMTAPIDFNRYVGGFLMKTMGLRDPKLIMMEIMKSLTKYQVIHKQIFGSYSGEIMPEPTKEKMKLIKGTFLQFIRRYGLTSLIPLFQASSTFQGYGQLDEIAALYGLMWNTPNFINGFKERLMRQGFGDMNVLKSGFQNLWETIVEKENIQVTFNVDILQVFRPATQRLDKKTKCRDVWIAQRIGKNGTPKWVHYNFLIWSPEMKDSLHLWKNPVSQEVEFFSKTQERYFTTSLIDTKNMIRGLTPIDYWVDNMAQKKEYSVWAQRDSYGVLNKQSGTEYRSAKLPTSNDENDRRRSTVVYQMGRTLSSERYLMKILRKHIKGINGEILYVLDMKTWRYFPRYSPEDMEKGILWRILEIQGRYNIWYIGSSVSFESVKSVVEYNRLIVENMESPDS